MKLHKCSYCNTLKLFPEYMEEGARCDIVEQTNNELFRTAPMERCGGVYEEVEISNGITLTLKEKL